MPRRFYNQIADLNLAHVRLLSALLLIFGVANIGPEIYLYVNAQITLARLIYFAGFIVVGSVFFFTPKKKDISDTSIYKKNATIYSFMFLAYLLCYADYMTTPTPGNALIVFVIYYIAIIAYLNPNPGFVLTLLTISTIFLAIDLYKGFGMPSMMDTILIGVVLFSTCLFTRRITKENLLQKENIMDETNAAKSADRSKSIFLANMSHELRTPINAIRGMNEMVMRETLSDKVREYANLVSESTNNLLATINDIIDFAKSEGGSLEVKSSTYDCASLLNDCYHLLAKKVSDKKLDFVIENDPEMPRKLQGDEVRLRQIITSFLRFALEGTQRGKIELNVSFEKLSENNINLKLTIKDSGMGLSDNNMQVLFKYFRELSEEQRNSIRSTELSMHISKQLIDAMDGKLEVETFPGKGTSFNITIPQSVVSNEPIGSFKESIATSKQRNASYKEGFHAPEAKVMVVDDVEMNLEVIKGLLKKTMVQIDTYTQGKEAVEACKRNHYDIIFIDHMMPEMSGIEVREHIANDPESINKEVPLIALTANAVQGAKQEYLQLGFHGYLSKPVDSTKLEKMMIECLPPELMHEVTEPIQPAMTPVKAEPAGTLSTPLEPHANIQAGPTQTLNEPETSEAGEPDTDAIIAKLSNIGDISTKKGIEASGSPEVYVRIANTFTTTLKKNADIIEEYFKNGDIENYTIQVHALKSSARLIGALDLSERALNLELAGKDKNMDVINQDTDFLLKMFRSLEAPLKDALGIVDDSKKPKAPVEMLTNAFKIILECMDNFDFDTTDKIISRLDKYSMPDEYVETFDRLKQLVTEVEHDEIVELLKEKCI